MRWIALVAVLGLVACGDDEGDCYVEVEKADGSSVCLPDPSDWKLACIQNPKPRGTGKICEHLVPCDGVLVLDAISDGSEYQTSCDCVPSGPETQACDEKIRDVPSDWR